MPGWEELGMQTASNVANGVLGLALGGINDRRQLKQQEKLQNLQIAGSKQLTDYNAMKQMEMWKNTNYPAQMAMLKQAGLNPALIYDNGGGGASTSLATGNVSGADAPRGGQEAVQMMGLALQRQMQAAQIELTKAQTQKTIAETGAVQPQIEKTQTETASIAQGIQNQKATEELTKEQTRIANVSAEIAEKSENLALSRIKWETEQSFETVRNLKAQNTITEAEANNIETRITLQLAEIGLRNSLTKAQTDKTKTESIAISNEILQKWEQVKQGWTSLDIQSLQANIHKFEAETKAQYPGIFPLVSKWVNYLVETLAGKEAPNPKPIK